eukprot:1892313-Amphidinium_carterae.1
MLQPAKPLKTSPNTFRSNQPYKHEYARQFPECLIACKSPVCAEQVAQALRAEYGKHIKMNI